VALRKKEVCGFTPQFVPFAYLQLFSVALIATTPLVVDCDLSLTCLWQQRTAAVPLRQAVCQMFN
jgi:hypothetical protein